MNCWRPTNAEFVREGLAFFDQAWQIAEPKQRKNLLHLYIHRIIWTPEKIKMGLYTRPVSELCIKSTTVNHNGLGAVDSINWLRIPPIHCEDLPWWQEFYIHQQIKPRQLLIGIGAPPEKPEKIYECPLLEAKRYENLLGDPFINNQSDIARELGITRARVSQRMALLKLTPEIQKALLELQDQKVIRFFSQRRLRPLLSMKERSRQIREFHKIKQKLHSLS